MATVEVVAAAAAAGGGACAAGAGAARGARMAVCDVVAGTNTPMGAGGPDCGFL